MEAIQRIEQERANESPQLVERMDSAIGEASTSIGMIMSEMVRRSLRGGVAEIGSSIHDYAREQVSAAVDEIMPTVSKAVEELAETTSHRVADEAVQKFEVELKTVEARTVEQSQVIANRFKEESDAALAVVKVAVTESRDTAETAVRDLGELRQRAKESWKKVQADLQTTNEARAELERRLSETSQELGVVVGKLEDEKNQHLQTREKLLQTESALAVAQDQLKQVAHGLSETQQNLTATQQQAATTQQQAAATQQRLVGTQQKLAETEQELSGTVEALNKLSRESARKTQQLESLCSGLVARLDELERPKGIKALFSKFTGGKKVQKPGLPAAEETGESGEAIS